MALKEWFFYVYVYLLWTFTKYDFVPYVDYKVLEMFLKGFSW